jgi:hypothetical protein
MYLNSGANGFGLVTRMTLRMIIWLAQKPSVNDRELMPRRRVMEDLCFASLGSDFW